MDLRNTYYYLKNVRFNSEYTFKPVAKVKMKTIF